MSVRPVRLATSAGGSSRSSASSSAVQGLPAWDGRVMRYKTAVSFGGRFRDLQLALAAEKPHGRQFEGGPRARKMAQWGQSLPGFI